jgi:hypothetical protein
MSLGRGWYANPRDGDRIEFEVLIDGDVVVVRRTKVTGCRGALRAAKKLRQLAFFRSPEDVAHITAGELIRALVLPRHQERCAMTAIAALRAALLEAHLRSSSGAQVGPWLM